jgi:hypothetical protein
VRWCSGEGANREEAKNGKDLNPKEDGARKTARRPLSDWVVAISFANFAPLRFFPYLLTRTG